MGGCNVGRQTVLEEGTVGSSQSFVGTDFEALLRAKATCACANANIHMQKNESQM